MRIINKLILCSALIVTLLLHNSVLSADETAILETDHGIILSVENKLITIQAESVSFKTILKTLAEKAQINVQISDDIPDHLVSLNIKNMPVESIEQILRKMKLSNFAVTTDKNSDNISLYILAEGDTPPVNNKDKKLTQAPGVSQDFQSKTSQAIIDNLKKGISQKVILRFDDQDIRQQAQAFRSEKNLQQDDTEIIQFKAKSFAQTKQAFLAQLASRDITVLKDYDLLPFIFVEVSSYQTLLKILENPSISRVNENRAHDRVLSQSLPLIGQPQARANGHSGAGTAVAVLDTGVDYTRSAFGNCSSPGVPSTCKVAYVQDFAANDGSLDDDGHGTNVSAIVVGVAPDTKILGLDVFRTDGLAYDSEILAAGNWVLNNRAKYNIVAVNLSMGDHDFTPVPSCPDSTATSAFSLLRDAGIVPVVSSGNQGSLNGLSDPACAPGAVSVGAVYDSAIGNQYWGDCTDYGTYADKVVCFSNRASTLTLHAPGAIINAGGWNMSGTSMAAPHVSGAVALVKGDSAFPSASVDQATQLLTNYAKPISGHSTPRLDIYNSLNHLPPIISSFKPTSAGSGEQVIITGKHFNSIKKVRFGGELAHSYTRISSTKIIAIVGDSGSGKLTVSSTNGFDSLAGFTHLNTALQKISGIPEQVDFADLGQSVQLTVKGHYSNGTTRTLTKNSTFSSNDSTIVSVSKTGLAKAVNWGATTINIVNGLQSVSITANSGPQLSSNPTSVDFGTVETNTSRQTDIVITNGGGLGFEVGNLLISGTNAGEFDIVSENCTVTTLASSGSCTITLSMASVSKGNKSAQLDIVGSNPAISFLNIPLAGTSTTLIDPSPVDMGSVEVGQSSAPVPITITNIFTENMTINSLNLSGLHADEYSIASDSCSGAILTPGADCTINLLFSPTSTGRKISTLQVQLAVGETQKIQIVDIHGSGVLSLSPQLEKILASDGQAYDEFGNSVTVSGDTAIVGSPYDDDNGSSSGSAYIYEKVNDTWNQVTKLTASDGASYDGFGYSVSISADKAIIGSWGDDDNGGNSGSAYIFEQKNGTWSQVAKLIASDGASPDFFGFSVAISGDAAIVGSHGDSDFGSRSGSAYIFEKVNGTWNEAIKLIASDISSSDYFGRAVSISGDTAIIGSHRDDDKGSDSGSAYIFEKINGTWSQVTKLTASDGASSDGFGFSVAISGNRAVIGSPGDDDKGDTSGSVYLFEKVNGAWTQTAKFTSSDGASGDQFGSSVAVSGKNAIIGSHYDDDKGYNSGSAYLFKEVNGTWKETSKYTASNGSPNDYFGNSVSISAYTVIFGSRQKDDQGYNSGSAYINSLAPQLDSDNDGIPDELEDINNNWIVDPGETDPLKPDTDGDGIQDGTELGYTLADVIDDTDLSFFQPDLDPTTTTDPLNPDSDGDTLLDGDEDANKNGQLDTGETPADIVDYVDTDNDGLENRFDNCPYDPNNDSDGDGVCGDIDNCPDIANSNQVDTNNDGLGDVCTADCAGTLGGSAILDNCNQCVGGVTGNTACTQDCAGTWGGSAIVDNCNQCVEGITGNTACTDAIPVEWTDLVGVNATDNTITKTAEASWANGGAISTMLISGDGGVNFVAAETNSYRICGLSSYSTDSSYNTIEYGIFLQANASFSVYENGQYKGDFGGYATGDSFAVERNGTTINYKINGSVFYTSETSSSDNLLVDSSIYSTGGAISNAHIFGTTQERDFQTVEWVDWVGVKATGNTITKTADAGWTNGGATSANIITSDGGVKFLAAEINSYRMCGLSSSSPDSSYDTIEYAIFLRANATIEIYENGVFKGNFGNYAPGDRFAVERNGTTINYKKNGAIFYTSGTASSDDLLVDVSIYSTGGTISDARIYGAPQSLVLQTKISEFSPASAGSGEQVIITGSNLGNAQSVSFGGIAAQSFKQISANKIIAVVGANGTGAVSVTTNDGTAVSIAMFTHLNTALEQITAFPDQVDFADLGQSVQLTIKGHYSNGTTRNLTETSTFSPADNSIVSVSEAGIAQTINWGNTTINVVNGLRNVTITANSGPQLTSNPTSIDFGTVKTNTTREIDAVITNGGGLGFEVGNLKISGTNGGEFNIISENCSGAILASSESCTITLSMAPISNGDKNAQLDIVGTNPAISFHNIPLIGISKALIDPSPVEMGSIEVGQSSSIVSVTITNVFLEDMTISPLNLPGSHADQFSIESDTCSGATVTPGADCTVNLLLTPTSTGRKVCNLPIQLSMGGSQQNQILEIRGRGVFPPPQNITKITASDGQPGDIFSSHSADISGNVAIIGASLTDGNNGSDSGSAYIFEQINGNWQQVAKLTANDGQAYDYFGCSTAISLDVAIVGAYFDDDNGSDSGSAYIFERINGNWQQVAKLTANDGQAGDYFGSSTAISGNMVLVGAYRNGSVSESGSVYIFERINGNWQQVSKLTANDSQMNAHFGTSIAISGNTAIFGASGAESFSGAAYIFEQINGNWQQIGKLTANDGQATEFFGGSTAILGDVAIIGAFADDDNGYRSGSAYIFERISGNWQQVIKLTANDGQAYDRFGLPVAVSRDKVIVGAQGDGDKGPSSGSVYVFQKTSSGWLQIDKLRANDGQTNDYFGSMVSASYDNIIIGAYGDDDKGNDSGSAYIYSINFTLDSDNDGIPDALEDINNNWIVDAGETDPLNPDTDGDGIQDGTELGYTLDDVSDDTDLAFFQPDLDPTTTTDPLNPDSDGDTLLDGDEDTNKNGQLDTGETPADIADYVDTDNDGLENRFDNCPSVANSNQSDCDQDSIGDACDTDSECSSSLDLHNYRSIALWGAGQTDCSECHTSDSTVLGTVGTGSLVSQSDVDRLHSRVTGNKCDLCHAYNSTTQANNQALPLEETVANAITEGMSGTADATCLVCHAYTEIDADGDGVGDSCDICPDDPNNDSDGDGVCGDIDNCPDTPNSNQLDSNNDGIGNACTQDCDGVWGGTAVIDNCGQCVEGTTGNTACTQDCGGIWGGTAVIDNCGQCVEGTTGNTACTQDCNGVWGGTAVIDNCGQCVGGTTGNSACTQDCDGVWGGTAVIDNCGQCVGGTTGNSACTQDCDGVWGGTAVIDNCGQCVGGTTGNTACTQDCDGVLGGAAVIDNCGQCVGGTTGNTACTQDCGGIWGGIASLDENGVCSFDVPTEWTDLVGVSVTGNSIAKTAVAGWGNAGAASTAVIWGNGGIIFYATEANSYRMAGLSSSNLSPSYDTIEYAIFLQANATIEIYENGQFRGGFGEYNTGDSFAVERNGTTIIYKQNGAIFYTSNIASSGELVGDISIFSPDGTITDAHIYDVLPHIESQTVEWTGLLGVSANGNSITKTAVNGWGNAGAASKTVITGNGGVNFLATETNSYRMCGLSSSSPDSSYDTIEYAIFLQANATIEIYESGQFRGGFGEYNPGDSFAVERNGTTITYKQNGAIFYTSDVASSGDLVVDASIFSPGGTITEANIYDVVSPTPQSQTVEWTGLLGVSANGNSITKTTVAGWGNAGAASTTVITGNGGVNFLATETNSYRMCGLSSSSPDSSYDTIEYAIFLRANATIEIYESGQFRGGFGEYNPGDSFAVERNGTTINYKQNGAIFYTSDVASSGDLVGDISIFSPGGTVTEANIYDGVSPTPQSQTVEWTSLLGVSANGNSITKTAVAGWGNAGAASTTVITGNGGVNFLATETNSYRMCGLSSSSPDSSYDTIEYAIFLRANATIEIYESGQFRGGFGEYNPGDSFAVERNGTTINYKQNGAIFYTSDVASSGDLVVDASIFSTGGTITEANIQ